MWVPQELKSTVPRPRTDTGRAFTTLPQRFEAQVSRTPDATAVVFEGQSLSYAELNARANQLAHFLRRNGAGPDTLVGVYTERSLDLLVAIVGILKAGAGYLPLDPANPAERIAFIAGEAKPLLVLTQRQLFSRLPRNSARTICVDDPTLEAWRAPAGNPAHVNTPDHLAYVIYTSGSTGRPKGVEISHRNVVRLFDATFPWFRFSASDSWSLFHSYAFDFSVWEIWGALLHGGRAVVVPFATSRSPLDFYRFLSESRITILNQTPSAFKQLAAAEVAAAERLPLALRLVIFGGEALDVASLEPWFDRHGDRNPQLVNMYGITETTVHVTYCPLSKRNLSRGSLIGVPIPDLELHILDENLQPVPLGVAGEIFVGGTGVARGYRNRPDLTAARFIPDPFSSAPGARLYRTGDRARRLADGNHEYLGRLDRQVKVRGFRVELPEIEIALNEHPAVDSSAVITADDATGQNRLWAYFIPRGGSLPDGASLRAFLAQHLPEYMLPAGFTAIECWPLTANGKLDRASLPPPSYDNSGALPSRQMSSTEALLLAWCRDVVADSCLDVDQPLLDAGLHSLAFAQIAARIQKEFRVWPAFSELFACRTVAELANMVDEKAADRNSPVELVVARDRRGPLPLSLPQERIWFLERLHPRNLAYHFQSILRFHGRVDVPALEKSLNQLVMRHEILRTTFPEVSGQPCQQIHPFAPFSLAVEEVSLKRAEQRIAEAIRQPFDIERVPPVRWLLLRISAEHHWLLHMQHHLLHDGAEYEVFLKELFASYDAFAASRAPVLPPLSVQFVDFAIWQRQQLAAGRWDGQLEYWQKRLEAPPPAAQLPVDRQRPFAQTFAGAQIRHPFDAKLYASLCAACAREGVTPYMWLHAAFQAFLFRYTGQSDIVVGTGVANRESTEAQKLLGMIINTMALRISFAGKPRFRDILARTRAAIVEALDNQNAPFDRVVQRLGGGSALFNTFFDSYDRAYPAPRNDVLRVEQDIAINNGTCKFDLVALVVPGNGTPATLLWEYNTDLFTEQTASRMMRHFLALLAESVADPSLRVALLPMLSQQERNRVIEACRARSSPSSPDRRLDQIFAAVVSARPDSVAIVCGNEKLTYRELDQRATRLADELRAFGACNGQVVAFSLPRSPQAICVMAAILKSGCAYLPLDPKLPSNRRRLMLQAAGPSLLLTAEGIARVASGPQHCPDRLLEDAACVLFTSGSTGVPNPVCVPHRAIVRLACDVDYVRLERDTRFLQLAPLAFDASSLEIWGPLLNGGAVIIHPEDLPDFAELGRTIASHGVTTAWLTASLFNQIIDAAPEILRPLRQLLTGGEALSVPHVVRALAALPGTTLINGYGPTEGTTFSTTFTIPRDFDFAFGRVPIGRPIPGTQVYVLDEYQQLLPIGVPGEICIGGTGLAAGYLGDAALTAAKFVPDTISGLPGARLYRTGDCGRLLADGTLDCIGRLDRQVKIRGFRIEPAEIEAALLRYPCVAQAVVIAREDTPGDKQLVAYVVGASDQAVDAGALRAHLGRSLPSYMVPTAFVVLERLPLTPNGKLDQRALPKPEQGPRQSDDSFVAPRSPTEAALARIWRELLGVERVGIHDNFFELGGHSLLTLQLRSQIQRILQIEVSLADIYKWPTIEGIAVSVLRKEPIVKKRISSVVQLQAGSAKLPLYFIGVRPYLIRLAQLMGVGHSVFAIEIPWLLSWRHAAARNETAAMPTVEQFVAPLAAELSDHVGASPCVLAGFSFEGVMAFEVAHQLQRLGVKVKMVMLLDTWLKFPSPHYVARGKLRHAWIRIFDKVRAEQSVDSIGSRLRCSWLFCCWILVKGRARISRLFRRPSFAELSAQSDEQGPVPFELLKRLYLNARKSYDPRVLDCHGVLFKADPKGDKYQEYLREFDGSLGWKGLFAKGLEINLITGDHFVIGESLARKMTEVLERYWPSEGSAVRSDPETGEVVRAGEMGAVCGKTTFPQTAVSDG